MRPHGLGLTAADTREPGKIDYANPRENKDADRAAFLTRRRSAPAPGDRIADTAAAPELEFRERCRAAPAARLNNSVLPHVTWIRRDRTDENGPWWRSFTLGRGSGSALLPGRLSGLCSWAAGHRRGGEVACCDAESGFRDEPGGRDADVASFRSHQFAVPEFVCV